jgi:hypothetical protein
VLSSSAIVYDPALKIYAQEITLENTGTTAVAGPLFFILEDLPSGVTLLNKSAATTCFAPVHSGPSRRVFACAQHVRRFWFVFQRPIRGCDLIHAADGRSPRWPPIVL